MGKWVIGSSVPPARLIFSQEGRHRYSCRKILRGMRCFRKSRQIPRSRLVQWWVRIFPRPYQLQSPPFARARAKRPPIL
ncbi:hypothetical protein FCV25MIE_19660 [Fagus crenata]